MPSHSLLRLLALLLVLTGFSGPLPGAEDLHRVWAIKDARIFAQNGPPIEKGVVVIRDGLIQACGPAAAIPPEAEVVDGAKLSVYPGFTDCLGQALLKFPEEKMDMSRIYAGDFTDKDKGVTPALKAFDFLNLGKATFEKYYRYGFTAAQVLPDRGVLTGRSTVVCFSDPDKNKALLLDDVWLGIGFSPAGFMVYPNSLMGVNSYLRQAFTDAVYFDQSRSRWLREMRGVGRPEFSPNLAALGDYATGKKPVVFLCRNQHDIRRALALAAELKLVFLIADLGGEASAVIPELKSINARVLCTVAFKAPGSSLFAQRGKDERQRAEKEIYPKNPARLAEAGVPFAFSSLGTDDPKTFAEGIQKAIEAGLPKEKALDALTRNPALFLGLEKALGTIEAGKIANLVLTEGEILAKDPKVRYAFVDGKKFELKDVKAAEGEKPAVNVSGKWEVAIEGQSGMKITVDFQQEEAALSGKMALPFGAFDFTGGVVSGKDLSFDMTITAGGQQIDLFFSASVEGETMRGTVVQGTSGSADFTAKRIPG